MTSTAARPTAESAASRWRWRGLVVGFAALIAYGFYRECRQGEEQRADAARALACAVGPPPVAAAAVEARYWKVRELARARGKHHPQICRNTFWNAGAYHGNASSRAVQFGLRRVAKLLEADDASLDDAAVLDELRRLVVEATFDQPR
ncbi:MAG: hypothetical protein IPL61_13625 [Myxococcales bacterium]|nr:hypothetical protein [Myxococcales bacterium]